MTDRDLLNKARDAAKNAYAPYSRFQVGAAIECGNGEVFTGCNVENAALGGTICAERCAALKAISEGNRDFRRIAIWADSREYCTPCGTCRQFLMEFAKDMEILSARGDGRYKCYKLEALLPEAFNGAVIEA